MNRLPHAGLTGRRLLGFALRGGRGHVAVTTGAGLIAAVLNFATPVGALLLIGALTAGRTGLAVACAAALPAALLLTTLLGAARDRAATRTQSHMQRTLEPAVWDRLLSLDLPFFRRHPVRRLLRRAQGVGLLRGMLGSGGLDALLGALFTALALTLLAVLDPWLGVAALALSAVILAGLAWLARRQQRHDEEVYESVDDVQALMYPALLGIDEIHAYGAEAVVIDRWQRAFHRQKTADDAGLRYAERAAALIAAAQPAFLAVTLPLAPAAGRDPSAYLVIAIAAIQLTMALGRLNSVLQLLFSVGPVHARLRPILTARPESPPAAVAPSEPTGLIELENVSFAYRTDDGTDCRTACRTACGPILDGVSLSIRPGEFVAVTGPSGAGKSTLLRLMLGLDRPLSGRVSYDGQDLAALDLDALRARIGYVPQQGTAPRGDVRSVILGGRSEDDDLAWEAAELAGIAGDLRALPMGLATRVSDGDAGFSGGQLQRLLIARALAKRPRVLLLDEATSALDNQVQSEVADAVAHLGITRVVVAHRLSTIRQADRVLVVADGALREERL